MFIAEKVGKEWTMDQAPQYAIDHVANSKKNIFEFDFLNSLSTKISNFFVLTALSTKLLTKRSVLILYEYPNTVANLKQIEFPFFIINSSAFTFVVPYKDIGFKGDFSSQNLFFSLMP